jgi:hypothetical protein
VCASLLSLFRSAALRIFITSIRRLFLPFQAQYSSNFPEFSCGRCLQKLSA